MILLVALGFLPDYGPMKKAEDRALLTGKLKVQLDNAPEGAPVIVNREEVRVVRAPRRGGKNEKKADKPAQAEK